MDNPHKSTKRFIKQMSFPPCNIINYDKPKDFVPDLKPKKSMIKPSPLFTYKYFNHCNLFDLNINNEFEDLMPLDNKISFKHNIIYTSGLSDYNNIKETRSDLKNERNRLLSFDHRNYITKDDYDIKVNSFLSQMFSHDIKLIEKSMKQRHNSIKLYSRHRFNIFNDDIVYNRKSSLYYWFLEKRKQSSILGSLQVKRLERELLKNV